MSDENFVKHDSGKPQYSLLPTRPLEVLVKIYGMGAEKYSRDNWRKGCEYSRIYDALQRHLNAFWGGEDLDKESGLPHVIHAAWGCFTLCEFLMSKLGKDDRSDKNIDVSGVVLERCPVCLESSIYILKNGSIACPRCENTYKITMSP